MVENKKKKTLILGLGNTILSDDGAGIIAARQVYEKVKSEDIAYSEVSFGAWRLLDIFSGYDRIIVIDVFLVKKKDLGKCFRVDPAENTALHLQSTHGLGFFESIELAKNTGQEMPQDISVYAIGVKNIYEFGETLTPEVKESMPEIVNEIIKSEFAI